MSGGNIANSLPPTRRSEKKALNKMAQLSRVYAGCPEVKGERRPLITLDLEIVFGGMRCFKENVAIDNGTLTVVRLPYPFC